MHETFFPTTRDRGSRVEAGDRPRDDKVHVDGTHRSRPLHETVTWARGLAPRIGITRVADVTGLDDVGIPVVMVCRPSSRSLSVSQGKGVTLAAAEASGLMESIELHHAEHIDAPLRLASWRDMDRRADTVPHDQVNRWKGFAFDPDLRIPWIEGTGLRSGRSVWVPFELVDLDRRLPRAYPRSGIDSSSNGLASGNTVAEAVSHALSEVIERDSITMWHVQPHQLKDACRVDAATIDDPHARAILDRLTERNMIVDIWNLTGPLGLPCFEAWIGPTTVTHHRRVHISGGWGCHPDRGVALLRAITESAQGRLTTIAGSRDDLDRQGFHLGRSVSQLEGFVGRDRSMQPVRFGDIPSFVHGTIAEDVELMLGATEREGLGEPIVIDLRIAELGVPVAKVIVPGAESGDHQGGKVLGRRARAVVDQHLGEGGPR